MVGMSGKGSEPRRSGATSRDVGGSGKKQQTGAHSKQQPPVEALQMARMLDETFPSDLHDKIQQVRAIVPNCSEEEVCIALHDHDYDPEKAISALLDSEAQGQWTTTARKGKKKSEGGDTVMSAPGGGDAKSRPSGTSRTTSVNSGDRKTVSSKAAAQSTREGFGGSVHVEGGGGGGGGGGRGRNKGRSQSGRGRSISGRRPERSKGNSSGEWKGKGGGGGGRDRTAKSTPSIQPSAGLEEEEEWAGPGGGASHPIPIASQEWGEPLDTEWTTPTGVGGGGAGLEQAGLVDTFDGKEAWESDQPTEVFPEAIPALMSHGLMSFTTTAESTPSTTPPSSERTLLPPATQQTHSGHVTSDSQPIRMEFGQRHHQTSKHKSRRLARSQIPTKPVEMPGGIDSLDVEFGTLGVGSEPRVATPPSPPSPFTTPQLQDAGSTLLPYSDVQRLNAADAGGVVTASSKVVEPLPYQVSPPSQHEVKREGPPGLMLPAQAQPPPPGVTKPEGGGGGGVSGITLPPPEPITLPSSLSTPHTDPPAPQPPTPSTGLIQGGVLATPTLPLHTAVTLPPAPIELPANNHITTEPSVAMQQHSFSVANSGAELLLAGGSHAHSSATTPTSTRTTHPHHGTLQGQAPGKPGAAVPPGMVYPHMMPQFPYMQMPTYYTGDPSDMSRYQATAAAAASMGYYPTTSDPSGVGGVMSRDHTSFGVHPEAAKFGGVRGTTDVTSPVSSNHSQQQQQQQQQQGLQQGQQMQFYPYVYPYMYTPMHATGYSAPSMGPKPAVSGSNFPVSSYQSAGSGGAPGNFGGYDDMTSAGGAGGGHEFSAGGSKMYGSGLNKSTALPSTTGGGSDISSSFKQQQQQLQQQQQQQLQSYDKAGSSNYFQNQQYMQYMQMPVHHMPMVPTHDGAQSRSQGQKHSNKYNQTGGYWPPQGSHTS